MILPFHVSVYSDALRGSNVSHQEKWGVVPAIEFYEESILAANAERSIVVQTMEEIEAEAEVRRQKRENPEATRGGWAERALRVSKDDIACHTQR